MLKYTFKPSDKTIWVVIILHFFTAICFLIDSKVGMVTRVYYTNYLFGSHSYYIYFLSCTLGFIGLAYDKYYKGLLLLMMPQQLLMLNCVGVFISIYNGVYPNGHIPEGKGVFILVDQLVFILLFFSFTFEISRKWVILTINTKDAIKENTDD